MSVIHRYITYFNIHKILISVVQIEQRLAFNMQLIESTFEIFAYALLRSQSLNNARLKVFIITEIASRHAHVYRMMFLAEFAIQ